MIFGGLQKQSLIDFPGKISCVLFTSGCNFTCPYCHNPDLARGQIHPSRILTEESIYDFLEKRKDFLDGVVISGGEPTLHRDLSTICHTIKKMGYPVKLDTNGSRPEILEQLIQNQDVDYIAMDIKSDPAAYPREISSNEHTAAILESIALIMAAGISYEFRTTCIKPFLDRPIVEKIAHAIQGAQCYALQQFKDANVLSPEYFRHRSPHYSRADLEQFQTLAAPWVEACIVR